MTNLKRRAGIAAISATVLGLGLPLTLASADDSAALCLQDGNVWVFVEIDDAVLEGCATEFATGFEALTSAGIEYTESGGFITTIEGEPGEAGPQDWWSYWSGTASVDGAVEWESYMVGASQSEPEAGTIEGWRLAHSWEDAPAPSLEQLELPQATATPTVTASVSASPSASASPSVSPSATASATTAPTVRPTSPGLPSTGA